VTLGLVLSTRLHAVISWLGQAHMTDCQTALNGYSLHSASINSWNLSYRTSCKEYWPPSVLKVVGDELADLFVSMFGRESNWKRCCCPRIAYWSPQFASALLLDRLHNLMRPSNTLAKSIREGLKEVKSLRCWSFGFWEASLSHFALLTSKDIASFILFCLALVDIVVSPNYVREDP